MSKRFGTKLFGALAVMVCLSGASAWAGQGRWAQVADQVIAEVDKAEAMAKDGKPDDAKEAAINAYFGVFEELKMEIAERQTLGAAHVAEIESLFNELRKASGKSRDIKAQADALRKMLKADGKALDAAGAEVQ